MEVVSMGRERRAGLVVLYKTIVFSVGDDDDEGDDNDTGDVEGG